MRMTGMTKLGTLYALHHDPSSNRLIGQRERRTCGVYGDEIYENRVTGRKYTRQGRLGRRENQWRRDSAKRRRPRGTAMRRYRFKE
jgi:hypothetical protein